MDRYIRILLNKLKDKVQYSAMYMIKYNGQWEQFYNKRDVVKRLLEIDKEE